MNNVQKLVIHIGIIFLVGIFVSCGRPSQEDGGGGQSEQNSTEDVFDAGETRLPVKVETVKLKDFTEYGEYVGEAKGLSEVTLIAADSGRVDRIFVEEGNVVKAGSSLAQINAGQVAIQYETAVLNEKLAKEEWEREKAFLAEDNSYQLKVDQAHVRWLESRVNLTRMKRVRNGALAITPITGVVVKKHIELYQELNTGSPTFQVADLTRMKIIVGVPEADIVGIRDFGKADVRFAALPNRVFEGVPMNFARARSDSTLTYTLEIIVDNSEGLLLSGTTAQVRLVLRTFTDVVVIPVRALFNRSEGAFAMIVENGVARERRLTLGKGDAAEVIVEGGLNPGAQIVVEGINRIADGSLVEIVR